MTACTPDEERIRAVFTTVQGDDWAKTLAAPASTQVYAGPFLVQLRAGTAAADPLVATSGTPPVGVGQIDTTGTDLDARVFVLRIGSDVTETLTPGATYTIECECLINGDRTTFLRGQRFRVLDQVAVAS